MLSLAVTPEGMQLIAWGQSQIKEGHGIIHVLELSQRPALYFRRELFRFARFE